MGQLNKELQHTCLEVGLGLVTFGVILAMVKLGLWVGEVIFSMVMLQ